MRIKDKNSYFIFSLSGKDFTRFSQKQILAFINDLKRNIPVDARHYFEGERIWQIRTEYRRHFDDALARHLSDQGDLFKVK